MAVQVYEMSRLKNAAWVSASNGSTEVEFWDLPISKPLLPALTDVITTVAMLERIDEVANRFYGTPLLWDVIADINGFRSLPQDMRPGTQVRVPSRFRVITEIRK